MTSSEKANAPGRPCQTAGDPGRAAAFAESALAPGIPADVAERILDRAEGVPLYAVETLRMLVDRGELEAVDGIYQVRGRLERLRGQLASGVL